MDQPQQPNSGGGVSLEWIMASILAGVMGLVSLWARSKIKISGLREKVRIEAAPQIEKEYLEANETITKAWQSEVDKLRAQIDKIREDSRAEISAVRDDQLEWMKRALTCESTVPAMQAEIALLKARVAELERQIEGKGHYAGQ